MQYLVKYGYYVVTYPIREALGKKPKYHFVYCTRHTDGVELMNDFIREEEDLLYGEHVEERLPLFEPVNLAHEEIESRQRKLRLIVRVFLENRQLIKRKQVIRDLILENFGYFHRKDYIAVFKELIDSSNLTSTDTKTRIDNRVYTYSS